MQFALQLPSISFLKPIEIFQVNSLGGVYRDDDIGLQINVPPGAIPSGSILCLEVGMCLSGPFEFPIGSIPVSPILMLHSQQAIPLEKPINVTLPHNILVNETVTSSVAENFTHFITADHSHSFDQFSFSDPDAKEISIHTQEGQGYASFPLSYHCFVSLGVDIEKNSVINRSFCICPLIQSTATWPKYYSLLLVYNIKPCIKVS